MPVYEYRAVEDGELIELIRPMRDADKPVDDPAGKGRTFERVHSTFTVNAAASQPNGGGPRMRGGGGCGCGNPHGPCGM